MTDESPTAYGPSGLLHTPSAIEAPAGTVRGALFVEGFSTANWLCTPKNPCGDGATSDRHRHSGALASLGYSPARGLELYLTSRAYANDSTQASQLLEVLGETTIGARYARALPVARGRLQLGGAADAIVGSGPGDVGLTLSGTSFRVRALSTLALDRGPRPLPLRAHLALSYTFDNTTALVRSVEHDRGQDLSRVERQGLGIQRTDRLEPSLGVEWLGFDGAVRPFVEGSVALPVNRRGWDCPSASADPERCRGGFASFPSKLTVGARLFAVAREGNELALLGALDLGLGGVRTFAAQVTPQAPWTLWLGLSMSTSTTEWGPKVMVDRVEITVAPPVVGLRGFVHPKGKATPIAGAIVRYAGDARPPLATDPKGNFGDDVPPGSYELEIRAPGYLPAVCGGLAIAGKGASSSLELDCPLEPAPAPDPSPPPPAPSPAPAAKEAD